MLPNFSVKQAVEAGLAQMCRDH